MNTAHDAGQTVKFLKYIPVTYASYSYSVIPIILAVYSLRYVERFVDKITPVVTKNFLKPMLVVLIEAPIALIVLGPLGAICGNGLSTVVYAIHDKLGFIAIGLVAGVYPFVVMAGMHHAFTPIKLGMIASTGFENFICIGELCSNMAQGAASLAVAVKSKNKDFKQIAGSSAFSALFAGITEPALYGVTLRLKRPMLGACIGAAAGGLFGGFFQMKCFGIATPAIVTIVQYVEKGKPQSLLFAALTILLTIVVAFIATMIIGFEDVVDENDDELDMLETEKYGYYHATNEGGYISWYDFTKEIFRQAAAMGHPEYLPENMTVNSVTTAEYGASKAARPFNSRLDKSKLVEAGFTPLPTWQDALSRYLKEIEQ